MSKVKPPTLKLEESFGFYHLFIEGYHDPAKCPECQTPGLWPSIPAPSSTDRPTTRTEDSLHVEKDVNQTSAPQEGVLEGDEIQKLQEWIMTANYNARELRQEIKALFNKALLAQLKELKKHKDTYETTNPDTNYLMDAVPVSVIDNLIQQYKEK